MDRLIKAEYRKIFTTKLWWALLIPAAALSLGFTWGGAALGLVGDLQREVGGVFPLALPAFAQGINFATVFALILGGTSVTGEIRHKTITTSYLTGPTRGAVLTAKLIVYTTIGALYGVVCMIAATLGALLGNNFPDPGDWFALAGTGALAMVLWTLFGVGLGALIGNQVGTIVGGIVYVLVVEPVIAIVLRTNDAGEVPPFLPNTSGGQMVSAHSLDLLVDNLPFASRREQQGARDGFESIFGLSDKLAWWGSGLIFAFYVLAFAVVGYLVARQRDIT
ncbi:ABC-type transport system involved in multi-copper enzyme maturation permease subunit [Kibdelosporangium banguiense]|uniref:ABC-type transport system involved in multi-copper enzyme maturation permease subunit n=1 Tax=Kibdelosporangium banguiense TaxID=1365924 RepID=A0ABS4TG28_9PSEU|nr:ABC transporter permease subunit [Kibdelosporangium banguiense]MBP2322929.1 ABC-type transport system involved in multi-copper enzyme maturation permease subunit [Kibdelosporangium banguiense]